MIRGRRQCDPISGCGKFYKQDADQCPHCKASDAFSSVVPFNPLDWIYDLECYPNVFSASFKHANSGTRLMFEISDRKNQADELYEFLLSLNKSACRLIGYSNDGYDYPMLHFFIDNFPHYRTAADLYSKSAAIIATPWNDRYSNIIWDNDKYITQLDLFKIHHFDNEARRTSLKMLEFNMRLDRIEDLPYEPGYPLTLDQVPVLLDYNDDDVDATELFYIETIEMIEFREYLTKKHDFNFMNHSDKKIGTDLFVNALEENAPGSCYTRDANGRRVKRQTIRPLINLADVIFPYINFKNYEFEIIKQYLLNKTIIKTKGVFEFLPVTPVMAAIMNPAYIRVYGLTGADVPHLKQGVVLNKKLKKGLLLKECKEILNRPDVDRFQFISGWKDQGGLNCIVNGFEFVFGTGGIHGSIDPCVVESDDEYELWDWDVAGYYPEVGNKNNLYPEHLSDVFCKVDRELKVERSKHKKGTPLNKAIKLSRNGAYGDSNNQYSSFFDSKYTMSITINGQLLLCMLAQYLIEIPRLSMVQINTDGLTVKCPREHIDTMKTICKWWEDYTCLELESVVYSRMMIRDVNNYIGEYQTGGVKRKGAYEYELEWHQNHSALVVPRAAEAALVHGVDIREFITNHADIFDFMLRTKVKRADALILTDKQGNETREQNITRYYISNAPDAGTLTKISPPKKCYKVGQWKRKNSLSDQFYQSVVAELNASPSAGVGDLDTTGLPWDERINTGNRSTYKIGRTDVDAGWTAKTCNNIKDANRHEINLEYYINEAEKLVKPLMEG